MISDRGLMFQQCCAFLRMLLQRNAAAPHGLIVEQDLVVVEVAPFSQLDHTILVCAEPSVQIESCADHLVDVGLRRASSQLVRRFFWDIIRAMMCNIVVVHNLRNRIPALYLLSQAIAA